MTVRAARRPALPLVPVTVVRAGWAYVTADGRWRIARDEGPGTPWLVIHAQSARWVGQASNLRAARWYVQAGHAEADLGRILGHEAGAHAAERDISCVRC